MADIKRVNDNFELEKAVKFLVSEIEKYCNNQKPLIIHCIRVALKLDFYGYSREIIQAALLHDILEDTKATGKSVKNMFGQEVFDLVSVSTFDKTIVDKTERYKENFDKAIKVGKDALVIRASDLLDNSFYYNLVGDKKVYNHLLEKLTYFLKTTKPIIGKEQIYRDLLSRSKTLKSNENTLHK
jgi:(p)ppGpp synthase/HD superfamily hydrolase